MQVGDRVRIRPGGATVFTVTEGPDEYGRLTIEPVGAYPFPMKPDDLIPE
ncbi:hypothetical protein GTA26_04685 [Rhodococcus hoagii]|nr:hypothetical protein [Prescottella equi]NKZ94718.1 hypothetical protein [Prescottella equi]